MNNLSQKWKIILFSRQVKMIIIGFLISIISTEAMSDKTSSRLQSELNQMIAHYQFSGAALTIIAPELSAIPLNFMSGHTQDKSGRPIITSDYFQIGSNTKSFIAALMVKLQTANKLSLNDTVTKWLPNYKHWDKVTISNLLHNNSGIPSYTEKTSKFFEIFDNYPSYEFTQEELVSYSYDFHDENKKPVHLLFEPGKGWNYSNTNWVLAGMIAEKVTQRSIEDLLKDYFLAPEKLNLSNTIYSIAKPNDDILQRLVHGYTDAGVDVSYENMTWAQSAGAILASNEDLAYWTYHLFHNKALTKSELSLMKQLVSTATGLPIEEGKKAPGYGLGIGLKKNAAGFYWGHEGHTLGYHSIFAYFPKENISIAVTAGGLKNSDYSSFLEKIMPILKKAKAVK